MHQSPLPTRRPGTSADGFRAVTLSAALAALAALLPFRTDAQAQAQPQPPAPAARGGIGANLEYPVLPIGSTLPDFNLPGVDGKNHKASEYSGKALAIVFESNHCPVSQLYEGRIEKLYADYKNKGVTLVAINPNNPKTVRLDELGYTDVTDSLPEMKLRAQFRGIDWPYLYDGETQGVSMKFGAVATPHIFIFDEQRKLRYQGRIDDNQREELVKTQDARNALDAILAGKPVPVAETRAFGCTTKWLSKASGVEQEWARIQAEPVNVEMVDAAALKELRANTTDKVMLVHFWSTGCALCTSEFFDLETTYRMYRKRAFNLVTVSTNGPADAAAVLSFLKKEYASSPNKQFASADRAALQAAWGEKWNLSAPLTMVDRAGRQRALPEGREVRHPRGPPHHPRRHARHQRLHRIEGVLDARGGGNEEEARHGVGAGLRRREKIARDSRSPGDARARRHPPRAVDAGSRGGADRGCRRRAALGSVVHDRAVSGRHGRLHRARRSRGSATAICCPGPSATPASGEIIGSTRYHDIVPAIDRVEIGYTWYRESRQRTAVNTTCKLLLLAHAFDTLGCKVVGLRTDNFNFRSQRAIEGLGAKKDGVLRHHAMRRDGSVRDSVLYSILAAEWPDVRRHLELRLARHAR